MRLTYLAYSFSLTVMYFSIVLLLPIAVALFYHETYAVLPFLIAASTALMFSVTLKKIIKDIYRQNVIFFNFFVLF